MKALGTQPWSWNMVVGGLRKGWRLLGQTTSNAQVMRGLLVAILLLAAAFRFTGLDWDEHQHLHPDERFLTMVENSLDWPESFKQYLDSTVNPLNPYNRGHGTYVYGLLPIALTKFVGQVLGKTGYDGIYLVGRALSGVMDMLCVLLVFLTGRRLYDARVGLLGALLLSVTVLNIQQSHYFTVDTATTLYVTLTLYLAVRVAQGDGWGSVLGMAVAFGLAVASKISVLSFLLIVGLAYLLRYLVVGQQTLLMSEGPLVDVAGRLGRMRLSLRIEEEGACGPVPEGERLFVHAMRTGLSLILVLVVGLLVFRVAQPQAFTGPGLLDFKLNPQWKDNMSYIQKLVSGELDYPPSHQWAAREPVWYMLKNQLLWGMGLPLGLTVWASWALMGFELYRKHKWAHLLPWVWMTFTFFYQSIQFVKTIRYLLPIYPTMALMAGYGLVWLWDRAKVAGAQRTQRAGRILRGAALAFIILVVVSTTLWAVAFTSIYTRPVTRLTASRWIYANLPQGSTIAWEVWDDPLPLNVDGHNAGIEYRQLKMDLYWEDLPEKRQQLYDVLREAQYISLSSNRLYGSIPRLPTRYPMTTRYYEALFSGELGFEPLVTFTSRPTLFGIEIVDDNADESFTVYDHPKVIIFRKRADFDMEQVRALFEGYELERIVRIMPRQVTSAPNNLMLSDWMWQLQRLGGTWSRIFQRESLANRLPTLVWLLAIYGLGLIASPIAFVAFRRLRDRGYILGKTLGMLLLGYLSWLLASLRLLPFTRATILGALGGLLLASAGLAWAQRKALIAFIRARWRLILANEVAFLGFLTLFLLIRWANPDLWHPAMGGEKPMDLAYLNAII
ncbi:MAG: glycosyltransferase family 39 protein, partial [Anaerolineae bacterium]|nr:glycosyltransferase family 39 protein [Anaerolineae bacterium]